MLRPHFALLLVTAAASSAEPPPPPEAEARKQLAALEDSLCKANVAADGPFFDRLTATEAIFTTPDGATLGREQVLAPFHGKEKPAYKIESCQNAEVVVRPYGTAAVVTGVVTVKGVGPQGGYTDKSRYTQVLVWRDGRWQLVAAHGSHLN
jgi:hypothetical protein